MGDLLDLIFSNFLIVAAIIGGVVSWFSRMTKDEEQKKRPMGSPRTEPTPAPDGPSSTTMTQTSNGKHEMKSSKDRLKEYYEEKQRRLDEISDHRAEQSDARQTFTYETPNKDTHCAMRRTMGSEEQHHKLKMDGWRDPKKWNKKRVSEGIIMAEILGPPRAHKPHSSHPRKR
jgi:hypothetical protein